MKYFKIEWNGNQVGVLALTNGDEPGCEILIDSQYRRMGLASRAIQSVLNEHPDVKFKVSLRNHGSLAFFRSLGLDENSDGQFVEFFLEVKMPAN